MPQPTNLGAFNYSQPVVTPDPSYLFHLRTLTASSSTSLDDTLSLSSKYDTYMIFYESIKASAAGASFGCRVTTDKGATWKQGAYDYLITGDGNSSYMRIGRGAEISSTTWVTTSTFFAYNNTQDHAFCGTSMLFNVNSTSAGKALITHGGYLADGGANLNTGSGVRTEAINGLRFFMTSGTIYSGKIQIYGVKAP